VEGSRRAFPVPVDESGPVILSHAHIEPSGRLPLLQREGSGGPIYARAASRALCAIMLRDSAYLHEKDADWENQKRWRKGLPPVEPLYTQADAEAVMDQFRGVEYGERRGILPGIEIRLSDAGHILGSAVVELWVVDRGVEKKIVFSGDLGYAEGPVMNDPTPIDSADLVLLESTYGDRNHRPFSATLAELESIFREAADGGGNVLIPAFAVGRTQDLLYLMAEHYAEWRLDRWRVVLDTPMGIEATGVYSQFRHLYRAELFEHGRHWPTLPNFEATPSSQESQRLNDVSSGLIIIAGSGMCTGGRIRHHLKHNLWRPECHVVIVGYQAEGTLGRRLVDGADYVRLWQEAIRVNAKIHTVGRLSADADQAELVDSYRAFANHPPAYLVHGEERARQPLAARLRAEGAEVHLPHLDDSVRLG